MNSRQYENLATLTQEYKQKILTEKNNNLMSKLNL